MAERKHGCGGMLVAREVQVVVDGSDGMSLGYRVHGLICNKCREQFIDRETALRLQASQTPTVAWHPREKSTTRLDEAMFGLLPASSTEHVAA